MLSPLVTRLVSIAATAVEFIGSLRKKPAAKLDPPIRKTEAEMAMERIQARRAAERLERDKESKR